MQNAATNIPTNIGYGVLSTVSDIKFMHSDTNKKINHILFQRKTNEMTVSYPKERSRCV